MTAKVRVTIDPELCIASGYCVDKAPDLFDQDVEGTAIVREGVDLDAALPTLHAAAASCPVQAITVLVVDDAGMNLARAAGQA